MSLELATDPKATCTLCRAYTYRLLWRPDADLSPGGRLEVRGRTLRGFISWRHVGFRFSHGQILFRWKPRPTVSEVLANRTRTLFRLHLPGGVRRGDVVEIELTVIPPIWAGVDHALTAWTSGSGGEEGFSEEAGCGCVLSVAPGPVERLAVNSRPTPGPDGTVRTAIVPEDRFGNPAAFEREVGCELAWNGTATPVRVASSAIVCLPAPAGRVGRARVSVPESALSARENVANGRREPGVLVVTGNPVWHAATGGLRPAFGEFHWHTDFSGDGQRSIREALRFARDGLNLDFAGPGDHNPRGRDWAETVAALEEFERPGEFATLFGWENASDRGHENYYFTDPAHPLVCGGSAGVTGARPETLVDRLKALHAERDFIAVPHHTNCVSEARRLEDDAPYWHAYPWPAPQPYIRLVEIFQTRGNQERNVYDDAWRGWHQGNGASVQDALALGHRLGFVGGTDNHCGWPGRAYAEHEGAGLHAPRSVILTGVWTPSVARPAVYEALRARHTWAVWDTRALVDFRVNGGAAGDEIAVVPGTPLVARLRLSAEDSLQTIEVVSEGQVVWQTSSEEPDLEREIPLGPAGRSTHFYLRALQRDGGIVYASPVFVMVERVS